MLISNFTLIIFSVPNFFVIEKYYFLLLPFIKSPLFAEGLPSALPLPPVLRQPEPECLATSSFSDPGFSCVLLKSAV